MWRDERAEPGDDPSKPIRRSLAADGGGNILRTEKGEVSCRCPATKTLRPMAFQGFEADRDALKHRCPAAACGLECAGRAACLRDAGSKAGAYGRVGCASPWRARTAGRSRRRPGAAPSWKRGYARRGALERINARLDNSFGFERHFTRGRVRMKAKLGLALAVMIGAGAGLGGGGPPGADALAGGPRTAAGGLTPPVPGSLPRHRPTGRGSPLRPTRANENGSRLEGRNPPQKAAPSPVESANPPPTAHEPPPRSAGADRKPAEKPHSATPSSGSTVPIQLCSLYN